MPQLDEPQMVHPACEYAASPRRFGERQTAKRGQESGAGVIGGASALKSVEQFGFLNRIEKHLNARRHAALRWSKPTALSWSDAVCVPTLGAFCASGWVLGSIFGPSPPPLDGSPVGAPIIGAIFMADC